MGPHSPDRARPLSRLASEVAEAKNGFVDAISAALIGSCTNSSYEDMSRAADVAGAMQLDRHAAEVVRDLATDDADRHAAGRHVRCRHRHARHRTRIRHLRRDGHCDGDENRQEEKRAAHDCAPAVAVSGVPHIRQNRASASAAAPHCGQKDPRAACSGVTTGFVTPRLRTVVA